MDQQYRKPTFKRTATIHIVKQRERVREQAIRSSPNLFVAQREETSFFVRLARRKALLDPQSRRDETIFVAVTRATLLLHVREKENIARAYYLERQLLSSFLLGIGTSHPQTIGAERSF